LLSSRCQVCKSGCGYLSEIGVGDQLAQAGDALPFALNYPVFASRHRLSDSAIASVFR